MTTDLLEQTTAAFADLLETYGYEVGEHLVSPSFGDALVLLESGQLRLRVTRDRGLVSVQVSGVPEGEWFSVQTLATMVDTRGDAGDLAGVAGAAAFIKKHHQRLVEMFQGQSREKVEQDLKELERASMRERFGYPG